MLVNGVAEVTIDYPVSEVGSPPFANILHYEPVNPALDPIDLVTEIAGSVDVAWSGVIANLDGGLTSVSCTARYLYGGIVYEHTEAMTGGQASGSQLVGGGSIRLKFVTQHGPKQRNGGIYLPAIPGTAQTTNTGAIVTSWRDALIADLSGIEFLTSASTQWQLGVMSKVPDTDPAEYVFRAVDSIVPATRATFYDSRY